LAQFQFRPTKADTNANVDAVVGCLADAVDRGAHLACFPEAALSGYFLMGGVDELAVPAGELFGRLQAGLSEARPGACIEVSVGFYERDGGTLYNSALHARLGPECEDGGPGVLHCHRKIFLPSYGVFDEARFVTRGRRVDCYPSVLGPTATLICEDAWHSISATIAALGGAQVLLVPTASPGRGLSGEMPGNVAHWDRLCALRAVEHGCFVVRTDLLGFEGGKGFAGRSTIHDPFGRRVTAGPLLEEAMLLTEIDLDDVAVARSRAPLVGNLATSVAMLAGQLTANGNGV
jgi:predicted amidohydrolase